MTIGTVLKKYAAWNGLGKGLVFMLTKEGIYCFLGEGNVGENSA